MKTQYYTATSLDGFIADENNSLDWLFQFPGDMNETSYPAFEREIGALAMGSTTYEWLLEHHIKLDSPEPQPWMYEMPAWVFSSKPRRTIAGADIRFVSGEVEPVHREMVEAAKGKNVWVVGGGDLVGQFHDAGLLDEVIVQIAPLTLGRGAPLLPRRIATPPMKLTSMKQYGPFVELRYDVAKGEGRS